MYATVGLFHRLPSSISRRFAERRPGSIGHITLRGKCAGARSAGKPHAACDVAGAGNGLTVRLVRHSHRKRGETDRPRLRSTAPALDPTALYAWIARGQKAKRGKFSQFCQSIQSARLQLRASRASQSCLDPIPLNQPPVMLAEHRQPARFTPHGCVPHMWGIYWDNQIHPVVLL